MQALRTRRPWRGAYWSSWRRLLTQSCTGNEVGILEFKQKTSAALIFNKLVAYSSSKRYNDSFQPQKSNIYNYFNGKAKL